MDDVIRPLVPVRGVSEKGERRVVYAMLDSGANCDCITRGLVGEMGIETREMVLNVQTIASNSREKNFLASFGVESLDGRLKLSLENALVA